MEVHVLGSVERPEGLSKSGLGDLVKGRGVSRDRFPNHPHGLSGP
jgi:hypothetical protein